MIALNPHGVAPVPSFTNARALAGIALYSLSGQRGGNRHDQMSGKCWLRGWPRSCASR